jgi:hypothetical protein
VFPRIHFHRASRAICTASYGIRLSEADALVAGLTGKVLKGAMPGDATAQRPIAFELVINQRAPRGSISKFRLRSSAAPTRS